MLGLPSVRLRGILSLERNQRKSGVEGHYEYPAGEQTQGSGLELHWIIPAGEGRWTRL